jgi:hypothetical protein
MESQNAPSADAHSRACRQRPGRAPPREPGGQTRWQSDSEHRWKQQRVTGSRWIEDTKIDRPRSWTATSRSRALDAQTEGQIHDISGRCEVFLHTRLRPPRVLAPAHSGVGHPLSRDESTVGGLNPYACSPNASEQSVPYGRRAAGGVTILAPEGDEGSRAAVAHQWRSAAAIVAAGMAVLCAGCHCRTPGRTRRPERHLAGMVDLAGRQRRH